MIHNEPLLTKIYEEIDDFRPDTGSVYIGLHGIEERSHHSRGFAASTSFQFLHIDREGDNEFDLMAQSSSVPDTFSLRSRRQLADLWSRYQSTKIYIDVTGLRHHVWIPILRSALASGIPTTAIYVEPDSYKPSLTPTEGQIYDLSERIQGIAPIPGFASFRRVGDNFIFVPLLGFEGPRVSYLLEQVQPIYDKIFPIVGVPGFRPEHPFNSYVGNRIALEETAAWQRIEYADANCPFSLYYVLDKLNANFPDLHQKIAIVGTKPHAIGAVLYVLQDHDRRELIYDHPIRKSERTAGAGRLLEYHVSDFI